MNKQEIASLAVKTLALYIVANGFISSALSYAPYLEQQFYAATQGITPQVGPGSLLSLGLQDFLVLLIPLLVAFLFWRSADWLGKRMVKDTSEQKAKVSLTALEIQSLVISAIGLIVTVNAVPQFVIFLTFVSAPSLQGADFSTVWLQLISPFLYVILGAFLFFRASRLAKYLQKK